MAPGVGKIAHMNLIIPMTVYVLYVALLSLAMLFIRIGAVKRKEVSFGYFKVYQGAAPDRVIAIGRHFDNQFQLPVLFFIACSLYLSLGKSDDIAVIMAWIFVGLRLAHAFVHLGKNHPLLRAQVYAAGMVVTLLFWVRLCYLVSFAA